MSGNDDKKQQPQQQQPQQQQPFEMKPGDDTCRSCTGVLYYTKCAVVVVVVAVVVLECC